MANIVSILRKKAMQQPSACAFLFLEDGKNETARLTYAELDKKARAIASYLQTKKLIGQRLLLLYPAGIDFICAFMGCLYAGVIAVPVNCPRLEELEKFREAIKAFADDADIAGMLSNNDYLKKINDDTITWFKPQTSLIDSVAIESDMAIAYQPPMIRSHSIAYLQYTSGSTASPKAVIIDHQNLLYSLKYSARAWQYSKNSIALTWTSHAHVYGLICGILVPLYQGVLTILMPADAVIRKPRCWLEAITHYQVTHSGCPNFGYDLCINGIDENNLAGLDLKSWKVAVNGGENVQYETIIKFSQKFGACGFQLNHFCSAYGMSEVTGTIAVGRYGKKPVQYNVDPEAVKHNQVVLTEGSTYHQKYISNGNLLPIVSAVIIDPATLTAVKSGNIGEIWLSGKTVARGYWQRAEETKEIFHATLPDSKRTYLRTGDLGFIRNGEICLVGRIKDVMVIRGKKYYPLDLEITASKALKPLLVGYSCAAFSIKVDNKEQIIFLQESDENNQEQIIDRIRNVITKQFGLDLYQLLLVQKNSLPKSNGGKLQRKLCKKYYLDNTLQLIGKKIPEPSINKQKITIKHVQADFAKMVADILNVTSDEIDLQAPLSRYSFDSINVVQLVTKINDSYQLALTPAIIFECKNLADFFNKISAEKVKQKITGKSSLPVVSTEIFTDIAIIGMSGMFPGAEDVDTFWDNLVQGKDCISEIPAERWRWQDYVGDSAPLLQKTHIKWGGFVNDIKQFDATFFNISPREAELTDPQQRLFLQEVWKAIEDAGYATQALSTISTGLFVGVFNNDYAELLQKNNISDAYITTGTTHSILANRISYLLNLQGPSEAIDTACSSSLVAIHHAVRAIQNGDCEVAIAGGVNILITPSSYLAANKAGMLSEDGRCKTFDSQANGYVRAEGVAAIVLKPLSKALADRDHIYGVIKGAAINHGGHVSSLTVPNPIAQANVIVAALQRAKITANSINYIETHGTGTALGDPIEVNGLKKAFHMLAGEQELASHFCGLGAVKTNIGHLEAAAGLAGVIKVLLALRHQQLPGNLHCKKLNPFVELTDSPFYVLNELQPWQQLTDAAGKLMPRRAGVSSFGFGGTNAHIIIEEPPSIVVPEAENSPHLLTLSAKTDKGLQQRIQDLNHWLLKQTVAPSLAALCYTLNTGRNHFDKRCAVVVSSVIQLQQTLQQIVEGALLENVIINTGVFAPARIQVIFQETCQVLMAEIQNPLSEVEHRRKLLALGNFYTEGFELPWQKIHGDESQKISLPTYPFAKDHYWIPTPAAIANRDVKKPVVKLDENNVLQDMQQKIMAEVADIVKVDVNKINLTSSLSEFGFDSIAFNELAVFLEETYKVELNSTIFFNYKNIQELSQYLVSLDPVKPEPKNETLNPIFTEKKATKADESDDIAIIGMQGYFPQADDLNIFWQKLSSGEDMVTEVPAHRWDYQQNYGDALNDPTKTNSKWGGFLNNVDTFDAGFFNISAREANLMDPQQRLLMEIVWKTVEDAGYDPLASSDTGIFVGVGFNEYQTLIQTQKKIFHGHIATGNSHALLANRISYFLNWHGPSEVIDTACSSSLVAIHRAMTALRNGECNMCIAGGVSLMLNPDTFTITSQLRALSPDGRCKTFDKSANGYVKGEGIGAVLLKPLSQAVVDGDHIYGVIKGSSVNHGGKAQSLTAPNAVAQANLLVKAYTQAKIDPETVSYIEAHGTGTELGDPIEVEGLKKAFALLHHASTPTKKNYCGLGSVKTNIGHLEPAAGIAGCIKVLLAMQHEKIPGNLHFNELNPYIDLADSPFYLVTKTVDWARLRDESQVAIPRRAGISSFGFGGSNAHIILEEAPLRAEDKTQTAKPFYLVTLSAKQNESLRQKVIDLYTCLKNKARHVDLQSLSFTLNTGRAHFAERYAIVAASLSELEATLLALINNEFPDNCKRSATENTHVPAPRTMDDLQVNDPLVYREKLLLLADLYTKNYAIDWQVVHANENKKRLASLPTYPFIKQPFWFDQEINVVAEPIARQAEKVDSPSLIINYLQSIFAEKLRISPQDIDSNATYEVYGVDSLIGLEITNRLIQDFAELPKTILYERNKISELANYLQQKFLTKTQSIVNKQAILPEPVACDDIAIIGLQGTFPLAENLHEFWDNLQKSRNCITEVPQERWDYKSHPVTVGAEQKYFRYGGFIENVDKFDPLFFGIAPREAMLMDPQERLFLQTAWAAFEDAGYTRDRLEQEIKNKVGVFVGATYNYYPLSIAEEWSKGNQLPLTIQQFSIANRVSYFMNLRGPSLVLDTACSSSLAAIHCAYESVLRGECEMALAGGVNLSLHPTKYHFLGGYGFLSEQGRCASFAEGGAGYVPGEGVGAILLKRLSHALRDNDKIYGVIKASSINHGGKTSGYTVPNPNAQAELIKNALSKAKIHPRSISYFEAHGTGTSLGDPIEIRGMQEAFEEYTQEKQFCAVGSVKSNIGHLEAAAGVSQLAKVLLQMKHKKLVPSLHAEKLNPLIDFANTPFYVQRDLTDWQPTDGSPRRAGISSFGAGGTNVHVIIEEFVAPVSEKDRAEPPYLFVLSAQNSERLTEYARRVREFLLQTPSADNTWMYHFCYTTQVTREAMATRLAILAVSYQDLLAKLDAFLNHKAVDELWMTNHKNSVLQDTTWAELAASWVKGGSIAWQELYVGKKLEKINFPTYPFAKRRFWVTPESITDKKEWLILSDKELGFLMQDELGKAETTYCFAGEKYEKLNSSTYYINPTLLADYSALFADFSKEKLATSIGIIYLWTDTDAKPADFFQALMQQPWQSKLHVCLVFKKQALMENWQQYLCHSQLLQILFLKLDDKKQLRLDATLIANELRQFKPLENYVIYDATGRQVSHLALPEKAIPTTVNNAVVTDVVADVLAKLLQLDVYELDHDEPFLSYGLDSINGIHFIAELHKHFADVVTPMDVYRYPTIKLLADYILASVQVSVPEVMPFETEDTFLAEISHLSDAEVSKLLEQELKELDELI